jgi:hypothetical protein
MSESDKRCLDCRFYQDHVKCSKYTSFDPILGDLWTDAMVNRTKGECGMSAKGFEKRLPRRLSPHDYFVIAMVMIIVVAIFSKFLR